MELLDFSLISGRNDSKHTRYTELTINHLFGLQIFHEALEIFNTQSLKSFEVEIDFNIGLKKI